MTKKELIEKLEEYPDDSEIILINYPGSLYTDIQVTVDVFWYERDGEEIKGVAIV